MADPVMALGKIARGRVVFDESASRLVVPYRDNADLIAHVARLGYLDGTVLDATYGEGTFWKDLKPDTLVTNDLYKPADHAWDFLDLPCRDGEYDSVVYDPDYKLCLDDETEILTQRGWLRCDEVAVGDEAYSLNTSTMLGEWKTIEAVNIYSGETAAIACTGKSLDFVATPHHRWFVRSAKGRWKWKTTEMLAAGDAVPLAAMWAETPTEARYSDAFVELVAWFWTEGSLDRPSTYGEISQSHEVNPSLCERIAGCFEKVYGPPVDRFVRRGRASAPVWRIRREPRGITKFIFSAAVGAELSACAPAKVPTIEFLLSLTAGQRRAFIETSFLADGQNECALAQSDPARTEAIAIACILDGRSVRLGDDANGRVVRVRKTMRSKPRRSGLRAAVAERVWCPTVADNGTWLARRRGRVCFTGNSGTPALPEMDARYGVGEDMVYRKQRLDKMSVGAIECYRVARRFVLVKCMDMVEGGKNRWQTDIVTRAIEDVGGEKVARFLLHYVPMQQPPSWKVKPADPRIRTRTFRSGTAETDAKAFAVALDLGGEAFESPQVTAANNFSTLLVFARRDYTPRRLL